MSVVTNVNQFLSSNRRLHFSERDGSGASARYGIDANGINIVLDNSYISFDRGARLEPYGDGAAYCIRAHGAAPTTWTSLAADALAGSIDFTTATDPGWQVNDWLEFRAEALLPLVPNLTADSSAGGTDPYPNDNRIGQLARVIYRGTLGGNYVFVIDRPLEYDFLVADFAVAGKATVIRGLVIEGLTLNHPDTLLNLSFGVSLRYCVDFRLINPIGFRSKNPLGDDLDATRDFLKYVNCVDGEIYGASMAHGGYYGHSIQGMCDNLSISEGVMSDVRHASSLVHVDPAFSTSTGIAPYGQPLRTSFKSIRAINTSISGFDEHTTGRFTTYTDCHAIGCGDDGFQTRTVGTKYFNCSATRCVFDGFSQSNNPLRQNDAGDTEAYGCSSTFNGRSGVQWASGPGRWIGGEVSGNATNRVRMQGSTDDSYTPGSPAGTPGATPGQAGKAQSGGTGLRMHSGLIQGARIFSNGNASSLPAALAYAGGGRLLIADCHAPMDSSKQAWFLNYVPPVTLAAVELRNNYIPGYTTNLFRAIGAAAGIAPISSGNITTAAPGDNQKIVTLSGGTATVAAASFRSFAGDTSRDPVRHKVTTTLVAPGGTAGAVRIEPVGASGGFKVVSTSNTDTSTYQLDVHL